MRFQSAFALPPKVLLGPLLLKPALFWLFVRGALAFLGVFVPAPIVSFGVLAVVFAMVLADMKILRERPFFDNLGIARLPLTALVIVLLEIVAGVAGRLLIF